MAVLHRFSCTIKMDFKETNYRIKRWDDFSWSSGPLINFVSINPWLLKMRNILLWNVTHFQHIRNMFFDDLEEIVPSFTSKNEDEKFSFIMECKEYDIACMHYKYLYNVQSQRRIG